MFNKFFRWYKDKKVKFWSVILIVIGLFCLIKALNFNIINKKPTENVNKKADYYNPSTIKSNKSVITHNNVEVESLKNANKTIDTFISFLNEGNYTLAYQLLTDDCKRELFPTVEIFKSNYYDKIFKTYKSYNMQNWVNNTYKIEYREDLLNSRRES